MAYRVVSFLTFFEEHRLVRFIFDQIPFFFQTKKRYEYEYGTIYTPIYPVARICCCTVCLKTADKTAIFLLCSGRSTRVLAARVRCTSLFQ